MKTSNALKWHLAVIICLVLREHSVRQVECQRLERTL
jgi:hypothetical protein